MLSSTLRGDRWIVYKARGSTLSEMLRGERRGEGDVTEVCDESDKNFLCVLVSSTGLVSSGYPSSSNPETLRLNQDGDGGSTDIRSEARKSSEQQLEGGDAVRVVGSTNSYVFVTGGERRLCSLFEVSLDRLPLKIGSRNGALRRVFARVLNRLNKNGIPGAVSATDSISSGPGETAATGQANGFGMCWGGLGKLRVRSAKSTLLPELAVFCKEEGVGTVMRASPVSGDDLGDRESEK